MSFFARYYLHAQFRHHLFAYAKRHLDILKSQHLEDASLKEQQRLSHVLFILHIVHYVQFNKQQRGTLYGTKQSAERQGAQ